MNNKIVGLLYDHLTSKEYMDSLEMWINGLKGFELLPVSMIPGSKKVMTKVKKLMKDSDVILIDGTVQNTNIGIEIGESRLKEDDRVLIFISCSDPDTDISSGLKFFLAEDDCYKICPKEKRTNRHNTKFLEHIKQIAENKAKDPLVAFDEKPYKEGPVNDSEALTVFKHFNYVLKAPAAAFIFGEYSVTAGHPVLYLPLPLYIYAGINVKKQNSDTRIVYLNNPPKSGAPVTELEKYPAEPPRKGDYNKDLRKALKAILGTEELGIEIFVWSQAPTMCGLATSSAISACIARCLDNMGKLGGPTTDSNSLPFNENLIENDGPLENLFKATWKIDLAAFHSLKGSGAGAFASLTGCKGANPILYFSEARKLYEHDECGRFNWELGNNNHSSNNSLTNLTVAFDEIDRMSCWGFKTYPSNEFIRMHGRESFKDGHFALVFTGNKKDTSEGLAKLDDNLKSLSQYFIESPEMVENIVKSMLNSKHHLRYELASRATEEYFKLVNSDMKAVYKTDNTNNHVRHTLRTILNAYGTASMVGINSYWSDNSSEFLTLMESCQCFLEVMGLTRTFGDKGVTLEPYYLTREINSAHNNFGERVFGAKLTGAGTGGDILVYSNLSEKSSFEKYLRSAIHKAKLIRESSYPEFGTVHFSSSWIETSLDDYKVEGAQVLQ